MTSHASLAERLAAGLASRILHDISGPASGVASGLDLLAEFSGGPDGSGSDGAALNLAASSARVLLDLLEFQKVAFGAGGEPVSGASLRRLASSPFEARRPRLEWDTIVETFPALPAQAMLIFAQIAAGALAAGGLARAAAAVRLGEMSVQVDGEGPRAAVPQEVMDGLHGRDPSGGLAGRWAPSRFLHASVTGAGGDMHVTIGPGRFTITATVPAAAMT